MKITTLIEDTVAVENNLKCEHGLSMFIEVDGLRILFDTGQSDLFLQNAIKLGVDLAKLDYIIISHAHYDHANGLVALLNKYNQRFKLIVSSNFFRHSEKYRWLGKKENGDMSYKYNGINFNESLLLKSGVDITYAKDDVMKLSPNIFVFSKFGRNCTFHEENNNLFLKENNQYIVDQFDDEIAIGIQLPKGMLLILGCGHPGFYHMAKTVLELMNQGIYGIIGGTHLIEADKDQIEKSIAKIKELNIQFLGLSHCTGAAATKRIKEEFLFAADNQTGKIFYF